MTIEYGEAPDTWGRVAEVYAERDAKRLQELDRYLGKDGNAPERCPQGHNDWRVKPGTGRRYCYTCHRLYVNQWRREHLADCRRRERARYHAKKAQVQP